MGKCKHRTQEHQENSSQSEHSLCSESVAHLYIMLHQVLPFGLWSTIKFYSVFQRKGTAYHWHCSWPLQHNEGAWTPPDSSPCGFFHLPTCDWNTNTVGDEQKANLRSLSFVFALCVTIIWYKTMFTWQNGDGCPSCLPISLKRKHRRPRQVSDTPHSVTNSDLVWLELRWQMRHHWIQTQTLVSTHQDGDDAFVFLLYQVTNDFVVKVLHCLPLKLEWKHAGKKTVVLTGKYK